MSQLQYRPEIDGLRGLAVLAVVLFHARLGCPGGYVGVDVFFVISGYLITSLILKDLATDRFRLVDFWDRRLRRIAPTLLVVMATTLAVGGVLLLPADYSDLAESVIAQALCAANIHFWQNARYFGGPAELKPLLHTWSLAVEEQFYLVLPLVLVFLRHRTRRSLMLIFGFCAAISFGLSVYGTFAFPSAGFYILPTRAWELLLGSLLAMAPQRLPGNRWNTWLPALGLSAILGAIAFFDRTTRFPGVNALLPCLGAMLIVAGSPGLTNKVGRWLSWRPLVFTGQISYSLYLWHWPVLAYLRYVYGDILPLHVLLPAIGGSFALAVLSWRFVEAPFRRRRGVPFRYVLGSAVLASSVLSAVSLGIWRWDGLPSRYPDVAQRMLERCEMVRSYSAERPKRIGAETPSPPAFLLWGDSHAMAIGEAVHEVARQQGLVGFSAARSATVPALGTWRPSYGTEAVAWNDSVLEFVREQGIRHVVLVSRWAVNIDGRPDGLLNTLIVDEESPDPSREESQAVLKRGLQRTVDRLRQAGVTVWILRQFPQQQDHIPRSLARAICLEQDDLLAGVTLDEHRRYQRRADEILDQLRSPRVHVLDPAEFMFDESGRSYIWGDGRAYYTDDNHLSRYGARKLLTPLLEQVFSAIASEVAQSAPGTEDKGRVIQVGVSVESARK